MPESLQNNTAAYIYQDGLQTERLISRFLVPADIPAWAHFFEDEEAVEFLAVFGHASCEDMSKRWIKKQLARYKENRYGLQALISKSTGAFIGQCGLITQAIEGRLEMEISYHIFKKYWGQGYATEAAKCFIDYAFTNNFTPSIISIIDINNIKSQRVAEKNGLTIDKQSKWMHHDVYIYRIYKEQWNQNIDRIDYKPA